MIKISSIYSSGQWVKKSKNEYVYNSDNIQESSTNYLWNLSSGNWDPASKGEWSYNSSEKTWIWSKWDIASAEWVPTQMEYSHFNAENIDLKIISYWDRFASKWVLYEKFEWNYQDNGNKQEISGYLFEVDTNKWIENKKYYMYYSDHHSVIPENYINVYPNPATEFVVFSLKEISDSARIELYSIQGNKVIDQKLPVNGLLQINHLGVGLYLYRLNNKQIVYRGKFVKTGVLR